MRSDTNEVGLINNDIAKFSNSRGYGVGLSCEETLDEELNSEDPVTLFACITVGGVPPKCEKPADQVSLTFLSGSDTVFVKDACDSRLKKYIVSQSLMACVRLSLSKKPIRESTKYSGAPMLMIRQT